MDRFLQPRPVAAQAGGASRGAAAVVPSGLPAAAPSNGRGTVECPVCGRPVPADAINEHLDGPCCGPPARKAPRLAGGIAELVCLEEDSGGEEPHPEETVVRARAAPLAVVELGSAQGAAGVQVLGVERRSSDDLGGSLRAMPHASLPGQFVVLDFISEREEAEILEFLDSDEGCGFCWKLGTFNGPGYRKAWGMRTDLRARCFLPPERELPSLFSPLAARMRAVRGADFMRSFFPNEANAIDYRRREGHYLGPHCDDRQLSGRVLCNLCLAGDAVMTYLRDRARTKGGRSSGLKESYDARLPRRALQIQSGTVRYDYQHSIPNSQLLSDRRVSITFRQNAYSGTK